ncbi:MAG: hypothetical protein ACYDG0_01565 [Vulcanimicrobiaceae bacterium]|jgi:hypothetical protein
MEHFAIVERSAAVFFGMLVFIAAAVALKNDWKATGVENQVFKLMLALLAFGALLGIFAGLGIIGKA